jgi:hypothetical protein
MIRGYCLMTSLQQYVEARRKVFSEACPHTQGFQSRHSPAWLLTSTLPIGVLGSRNLGPECVPAYVRGVGGNPASRRLQLVLTTVGEPQEGRWAVLREAGELGGAARDPLFFIGWTSGSSLIVIG